MLIDYLDKYEYEIEQEYNKRILTCFLSEIYLFDDHVVLFFNIGSSDSKLKEMDLDIIKASCRTASFYWSSRRESNPQQKLRRFPLYPFNYGKIILRV